MDLPPAIPQDQLAALTPPTGDLADGDNFRIVFDAESSKLPQQTRAALSAISEKMQSQKGLRIQLKAFAGDAQTSASAARRLSLSRALAVRSFLIENGVRSTRIDVRALGNKTTDEITERVDITVVER
ncbi:MAG: OmpA family protein [Alphaproteobacteria bacterium]|nr:OmpA family protein [Alphaproteobacteria bacterium]